MTREETIEFITHRYPHINKTEAKRCWRKSDSYLRMLDAKHAAHAGEGTLAQFVKGLRTEAIGTARKFNRRSNARHQARAASRPECGCSQEVPRG